MIFLQQNFRNIPKYMLPKGMQVANMKKKRKRKNNNQRRHANAAKSNDPLHSYDTNAAAPDEFMDVPGEDGFFGENPNDTGMAQTMPKDEDKKMYLSTSDRTGKSTSGRQFWQERHRKGKFSKKYKKKKVEW